MVRSGYQAGRLLEAERARLLKWEADRILARMASLVGSTLWVQELITGRVNAVGKLECHVSRDTGWKRYLEAY